MLQMVRECIFSTKTISRFLLAMLAVFVCNGSVHADWNWLHPLPQGRDILDLWIAPGGSAVVVGRHGLIATWDGETFQEIKKGVPVVNYRSVWGLSADHFFVVGDSGTFIEYNNGQCSLIPTGTDNDLMGLWGFSERDVFVGGEYELFHWTETGLKLLTHAYITDIWGTASDNLYITGSSSLQHWDGSGLTELWHDYYYSLDDLWGVSDDCVFLIGYDGHLHGGGSYVFMWDGSQVSYLFHVTQYYNRAYSVWGNSPDDLYVCGDYLYHYSHGQKKTIEEVNGGLHVVRGTDNGIMFSGGEAGRLYESDTGGWRQVSHHDFTGEIHDIWGSGDTDIWGAGGSYNRGLIIRWNQETWSVVYEDDGDRFNEIWGSGPDDVFFAGDNGRILHWNGESFDETLFIGGQDFYRIWGSGPVDVYVIGSNDVFHFDGESWTPVTELPSAYGSWNRGIWGNGPDDVYIFEVGFLPFLNYIYHWNGFEWEDFKNPEIFGGINSLCGTGPDNLYVGGCYYDADLSHWDGLEWHPMEPPGTDNICGHFYCFDEEHIYYYTNKQIYYWNTITWVPISTGEEGIPKALWGQYPGRLYGWFVNDWDLSSNMFLFYDGNPPLGTRIHLPALVTGGKPFWLTVDVSNSRETGLDAVPLFVFFEIGGNWWGWDGSGFQGLNGTAVPYVLIDANPDFQTIEVIPRFEWPCDGFSADITVVSAMTDPDMTGILGAMDMRHTSIF